ncbi:MAG: hypothetical protein ACOCXM_02660 [Myxococcota bacterium]
MRFGWLGIGATGAVVAFLAGLAGSAGAGCSDDTIAPPPPAGDAGSGPPPRILEVVGDEALSLGFGEEADFQARYLEQDGTPVGDGTVSFAFEGNAHDSSLSVLEATTAADGTAGATVVAGATQAAFRIRIAAVRAAAAYIEVSVSDRGFGDLTATVQGEVTGRDVAHRAVVIFADASCSESGLRERDGDRTATLAAGATQTTFASLPAGLDYAVAVRLEGPEGDLVGWGCADATVTEDETTEVILEPEALPLSVDGIYDASLAVDSASAATLAAEALCAAAEPLCAAGEAPVTEAGELFLDALESTLREEDPDLADMFAMSRTSEMADDLALALDAAEADVGPHVTVDDLVELFGTLLADTVVEGPLSVDTSIAPIGSWTPESITVGSGSNARVLGAEAVDAGVAADIELGVQATSDTLQIATLSVTLPLGSLVEATLEDLAAAQSADTLAEMLRTPIGCDVFEAWAADDPTVASYCDADCAEEPCCQRACKRAAEDLTSTLFGATAGLDTAHPTLAFDTPVDGTLEETTGDLEVDALAFEPLTGAWGTGETSGDATVGATLDATRGGDLP